MSKYILDLESDGLIPQMTKVHCIVLRDIDTGRVISCADQPGYPSLETALDYISEADLLVGHNIIKFDVPALKKIYSGLALKPTCQFYDTLISSRLFWPELEPVDRAKWSHIEAKYLGRHSLAAWGERLGVAKIKFTENAKKDPAVANVWAEWSPAMSSYCEGDVEVSDALYKYMLSQTPDPRSLELEHEFAIVMSKQEQFGFPFNEKAAFALVNTLKAERSEIDEQLQEVFPPIVESRVSAKTGKPLKSKVTAFNPASRQQTAERLQARYPEIVFGNTDKGNVKVDDDVLEALGSTYPEAKILARYQLLNKRIAQIADGKESWLRHCQIYGDGRIHGQVNTNACVSGRCSHCIEENQLVTTPEGDVPIKDVKIGQYVYSYDNDFNLHLNKVLEVIEQGVQECYVLKWRTSGKNKSGSIVCTANHKFLTWGRGMQALKDIRVGERIAHLSVSVLEGRKHLCMMGRKSKRQNTFIKENLYKKFGADWHMHHVDGNKLNDSLDNLVVLTAEEHAALHHSGSCSSGFIQKSKFSLLRMLAISKGHPTRVSMDFDTFKNKCKEAEIDISLVMARYSKVTEKYITKRMVHTMLDNNWTPYKAGCVFKVDGRKSRIDRLLESHGILSNHWVESITYVGKKPTYDLSVDRHHNFICQELCSSNSSPNMAQVPSVGHAYGAECRSLFYAPEGWQLVGADASGLELRALGAWLAYFDGGEYARLVSTDGFDIHTHNARLFGIYSSDSPIEKATRDLSKRLIYCILYGGGARKTGSIVDPGGTEDQQYRIGKKTIDTFYKNLPAIKKLKDLIDERVDKRGYLSGIDGRRLQIRSKHSALNQLLQSTGAVTVKKATTILYNDLITRGLKFGKDWGFVAHVHDEFQTLVRPEYVELYKELAIDSFRKSGEYFNLKCPMTGEARVGQNWEQTH